MTIKSKAEESLGSRTKASEIVHPITRRREREVSLESNVPRDNIRQGFNMKNLLHISLLLLNVWYFTLASDELAENDEAESEPLTRVRRGGLSMLRLGRGLQMLRLGKRSMPMLRLGRSLGSLTSDELKYLLLSLYAERSDDQYRRQVPLPRYGREDAELQMIVDNLLSAGGNGYYDEDSPRQIRLSPRPGRYRRSTDSIPLEKQEIVDDLKNDKPKSLPLPRFGRYLTEQERALPLPRLGRKDLYELLSSLESLPSSEATGSSADKRGMHMLRLGRAMSMLRLGKRPLSDDPISADDIEDDDKRSLSMLRLGKRLHVLRLGKRFENESQNSGSVASDNSAHKVENRAMHMLRLGRSSK